MNKMRFILIAAVITGAFFSSAAQAKEVLVSRTFHGWYNQISQMGTVIRNDADLDNFIKRIPEYLIGKYPPGETPRSEDPLLYKPQIDFNNEMLVVILGPCMYCYVTIQSMDEKDNEIEVVYSVHNGNDEMTLQETPGGTYTAFLIKRSDKEIKFKDVSKPFRYFGDAVDIAEIERLRKHSDNKTGSSKK